MQLSGARIRSSSWSTEFEELLRSPGGDGECITGYPGLGSEGRGGKEM